MTPLTVWTFFSTAILGASAWAVAPACAAESAAVPITALAFSPDGRILVSNGPRRVDVRSSDDGSIQGQFPCDLQKITALAFAPGGEWLAASGGEPGVRGEVLLFDWRARAIQQRFTQTQDLVSAVAFSADGRWLAAAGGDHRARVWRRAEPSAPFTESFVLSGHAGPVLAIAFSPNGRAMVTASADRSIKVWSTGDGRLLRTFGHHLEAVNGLAMRPVVGDPDNGTVCACASVSDDRTVRVWQPEVGRMVRIIRQHRGPVLAVAYAPDGRSLFAAGQEGIVRRFEADSDTLLAAWPTQHEWIYSLAVRPDGKRLAAGDWAGQVKVLDLTTPPH